MALDPAGLPHLVFNVVTSVVAIVGYGAETLLGLTVQWASVTSTTNVDKTTVDGTLLVTNFGTAPSAGFTIDYYLSPDDQLYSNAAEIAHDGLAVEVG